MEQWRRHRVWERARQRCFEEEAMEQQGLHYHQQQQQQQQWRNLSEQNCDPFLWDRRPSHFRGKIAWDSPSYTYNWAWIWEDNQVDDMAGAYGEANTKKTPVGTAKKAVSDEQAVGTAVTDEQAVETAEDEEHV
ncbi:unnamed protein product [Sordaria macrospora k-hell]|uniref:WGS project CABT00000000 data, contig 2.18 n=1 Tax=Sordaria macrospora (strain ATCC MYA-333 / DSM 997 / K(L3346) / K-hell) TaxID=771870 RepID=F7WAL5_SORMK|nr:uncharacterized protein SMAC_08669 [Sordaria macrospora k-hell]XP_003350314.1 uncharacterized protein SMAC_02026 [Sordaria macrospora k-hell]CCC11369.1 unnamed protein product [Sordaria macrospora k-hell]CCC14210.1 unnamed protein product [Sordaria macrospora k-hell]